MPEEKTYVRKPMSEATKQKIREKQTGKVFTPEHRLKLSLSHQGIVVTPEWKANQSKAKDPVKRPVFQLDREGQIVRRFDSIGQASRETGITKGMISACVHGRLKTAGGSWWQFEDPDKYISKEN